MSLISANWEVREGDHEFKASLVWLYLDPVEIK
jgi:hypothetical protein